MFWTYLCRTDFLDQFRPQNVRDATNDCNKIENVPRVFEVILFETKFVEMCPNFEQECFL